MERRDVADNVTEITSGETCDRWLVIRRMLDASDISIQVSCNTLTYIHLVPSCSCPYMLTDDFDDNETLLPTLLSLWLIGTVCAEPETVISRAWVQSPDPAE